MPIHHHAQSFDRLLEAICVSANNKYFGNVSHKNANNNNRITLNRYEQSIMSTFFEAIQIREQWHV